MWDKKDMLDYCEEVGHQIGLYCGDLGQRAALYDLRRCKRYDKFLETLERLKHKIDGHEIKIEGNKIPLHIDAKKEFFDYLNQHRTEWREYKALIDIFAKDKEYDVTFVKGKTKEKEGGK
jgi:hypothetical protein